MSVPQSGSSPAGEARPPLRETAVAQVMTSTRFGAHPTAFTAAGLPILRIALDVERMGPALQPLLAPLAASPPRLLHAKLLAYKRGNRGTIGYDLVADGRPATVLGKLYPQPGQVDRVDETLRGLWRAFTEPSDSAGLGVPRPLGTVPELSMLVYVPVEGTPLDEVLTAGDGSVAITQTANWLSRLQGARLDLDRRLHLQAEVVNLQAWAALVRKNVADTDPAQAALAQRLAADLAATTAAASARGRHAAADLTPIHKDFHYKHVLVDAEDATGHGTARPAVRVIDFDEVRLGDPMYDVAHFCAHLRLLACRSGDRAAAIAAAEGRFLDSYRQGSGRQPGDSFLWYAAYTCLKIAKQLCSTRGVRPRPDGEEQRRQLAVMLEQGTAFHDLLR